MIDINTLSQTRPEETYEYQYGEDSEDMTEPSHLLAGGSVVPRHGGGAAANYITTGWVFTGLASLAVCIVLTSAWLHV